MLSSQTILRALPLLALALAAGGLNPAAAQPAGQEIDLRDLERKGSTIKRWVTQPITNPEDQTVFQQFFDRYYFPAMTKADPESLGQLAKMRIDLFRSFIMPATPAIQQELTKKAYDFAMATFAGRHPRAVKVNAVLVLGMLDERYAARGQQAKPLPKATENLCKIVVFSTQQKAPAYLHVAAMVGLERHAGLFSQLELREKNILAKTLLAAINQQQFPAGTSRAVKDWMKMQAAEAIAAIGMPGPNGVFVDALAKVVSDDKVGLETRCSVAALMESLKPTEGAVPEAVAQKAVGAIKGLACAVAQDEKETAIQFEDLQVRTRRFMGQFFESDRIRNEEGQWVLQRRALIAQLAGLRSGVSALSSIAGDDSDTLASLASALGATIDVATEDNVDFDVIDSVKSLSSEVDRLVGCKPAPADEQGDDAAADLLGAAAN